MLIHQRDCLAECEDYAEQELPPLIVDAINFDAAFVEAVRRTDGADNDSGDFLCPSCVGLAISRELMNWAIMRAAARSTKKEFDNYAL